MQKIKYDFFTRATSFSGLGDDQKFDIYPGRPITVYSYGVVINIKTGEVICDEILKNAVINITPEYTDTESTQPASVQWTNFENTQPSGDKVKFGYIQPSSGDGIVTFTMWNKITEPEYTAKVAGYACGGRLYTGTYYLVPHYDVYERTLYCPEKASIATERNVAGVLSTDPCTIKYEITEPAYPGSVYGIMQLIYGGDEMCAVIGVDNKVPLTEHSPGFTLDCFGANDTECRSIYNISTTATSITNTLQVFTAPYLNDTSSGSVYTVNKYVSDSDDIVRRSDAYLMVKPSETEGFWVPINKIQIDLYFVVKCNTTHDCGMGIGTSEDGFKGGWVVEQSDITSQEVSVDMPYQWDSRSSDLHFLEEAVAVYLEGSTGNSFTYMPLQPVL